MEVVSLIGSVGSRRMKMEDIWKEGIDGFWAHDEGVEIVIFHKSKGLKTIKFFKQTDKTELLFEVNIEDSKVPRFANALMKELTP